VSETPAITTAPIELVKKTPDFSPSEASGPARRRRLYCAASKGVKHINRKHRFSVFVSRTIWRSAAAEMAITIPFLLTGVLLQSAQHEHST